MLVRIATAPQTIQRATRSTLGARGPRTTLWKALLEAAPWSMRGGSST